MPLYTRRILPYNHIKASSWSMVCGRKFIPVQTEERNMKPIWTRLIRFETEDGRILRGEPILPSEDYDLGALKTSDRLEAKVLEGTDIFDVSGQTTFTGEKAIVKRLLGPLTQADVPILRCVGLNYATHSEFCPRILNFELQPTYV